MSKLLPLSHDIASIDEDSRSVIVDDRTRHHAEGFLPLERGRSQLPHGAAVFNTTVSWGKVQWLIIAHHLLDQEDVVLLAGDEVVVTKSGKKTHGLDRYFSSLYGKAVPGLCFLSLSLISVKRRCSYPVMLEPVVKEQSEGCPKTVKAPRSG